MTESIKDLEIKTSMLFNLNFASNTISSCFFFFFLIISLYFLIPVVIAQILNPIAELVIAIGILIKEAKAEIEIYPVTVEAKIRKMFNIIQTVQTFLSFLLINSFCCISSRKLFLVLVQILDLCLFSFICYFLFY